MRPTIHLRYFAYGSNMLSGRIRQPDRAPSAVPLGAASLPGHKLRFHKRSARDGSGKCNIVQTRLAGDLVHGVLYAISAGNKGGLDAAEGLRRGYDRRELEVLGSGGWTRAFTYVAQHRYIDDALRPFHWYKDFVLAGADEHGLPGAYISALRRIRSSPDPNAERTRVARMIIAVAGSGYRP